MANTLKSAFSTYSSNLEITDRQEGAVSNCRRNVTNTLAKELTLHPTPSLVIGSWDRHTLTRYLSEADVDVLIVLHYSQNSNWHPATGAKAALAKFKQILQAKYKSTPMRIDNNCVTMKLSQFRLDVIPAFVFNDGSYRIPDVARGGWISTNPISFASLITNVNANMDRTFVPIIKMVKGWNRANGWPIRSIHLETMLYEHYKSYSQSYTYDSTLKVFFQALPGYLSLACYEPITGDRLDSYLDTTVTRSRSSAIVKAQRAAAKATEAYSYQGTNVRKSIELWKSLMGDFFPNYG